MAEREAEIQKQVLKNYNVGTEEKKINAHLKLALKSGVTKGLLKQSKGTGAAGSFRIGDSAKADTAPAGPAAGVHRHHQGPGGLVLLPSGGKPRL